MNRIDELHRIHDTIRVEIESRLGEFTRIYKEASETDIFRELIFCLLTPQSSARRCWEALQSLEEKNLLVQGESVDIVPVLNIVRFKNKKAENIIRARSLFMEKGCINVRRRIDAPGEAFAVRGWLAVNVKGMGYKEASHFLRNIGRGENVAILDRHILRNLLHLGVIDHIPGSLHPRQYLRIEEKMKTFSREIDIPLEHLDFVLWYRETGDIFK